MEVLAWYPTGIRKYIFSSLYAYPAGIRNSTCLIHTTSFIYSLLGWMTSYFWISSSISSHGFASFIQFIHLSSWGSSIILRGKAPVRYFKKAKKSHLLKDNILISTWHALIAAGPRYWIEATLPLCPSESTHLQKSYIFPHLIYETIRYSLKIYTGILISRLFHRTAFGDEASVR